MSNGPDNRQASLFPETDSADELDGMPPEIRLMREKAHIQELRASALQAQLNRYFRQALEEQAEDRLVGQTISCLETAPPGVMEDQGAENLWDEISVGLHNDSLLSEMYLNQIHMVLEQEAGKLSKAERLVLWLTTYWGEIFLDQLPETIKVPDDIPASDTEIAQHLMQSMTYAAENNKNPWVQEMMGYS